MNKLCSGSSFPIAVRWLQQPLARTCVEDVLEKSCSVHSVSHTPAQTNLPGCRARCKHRLLSVARGLALFSR